MTTMMIAGPAFAQTGGGDHCESRPLPSGDINVVCSGGEGGLIPRSDTAFGGGEGFHQIVDPYEGSIEREGGGGGLNFGSSELGGDGGRCVYNTTINPDGSECTPNAPETSNRK